MALALVLEAYALALLADLNQGPTDAESDELDDLLEDFDK